MTRELFFKTLNDRISEFKVSFNYSHADGVEFKSKYSFITINYNFNTNLFDVETKKTNIKENTVLFQYIHELSEVGILLPTLNEWARLYGNGI